MQNAMFEVKEMPELDVDAKTANSGWCWGGRLGGGHPALATTPTQRFYCVPALAERCAFA
jgi:hypothetical protein